MSIVQRFDVERLNDDNVTVNVIRDIVTTSNEYYKTLDSEDFLPIRTIIT